MITSYICITVAHLSCLVNCFVLPAHNIPFGAKYTATATAGRTLKLTSDEDFASYEYEGKDDGQQLASEFYQELEYRRKHGEETYTVSEPKQQRKLFSKTRQNAAATQKTAVSAGLFSGGGSTVYSSGRSIRAEIDILNRSMAEDSKRREKWHYVDFDLNPEQMETLMKILGSSLVIIAIAGIVFEISGGGVSTITLINDAAQDGISSLMISVGNGEVFMGEEAAWLMKESSSMAASIVEAVSSVEGMVLF